MKVHEEDISMSKEKVVEISKSLQPLQKHIPTLSHRLIRKAKEFVSK